MGKSVLLHPAVEEVRNQSLRVSVRVALNDPRGMAWRLRSIVWRFVQGVVQQKQRSRLYNRFGLGVVRRYRHPHQMVVVKLYMLSVPACFCWVIARNIVA